MQSFMIVLCFSIKLSFIFLLILFLSSLSNNIKSEDNAVLINTINWSVIYDHSYGLSPLIPWLEYVDMPLGFCNLIIS